ncbi:MAG: WG repeat-containing protein [Muribaculaceae bacterium]|nr:WG repeat-containing protein [Muribaculaceae bacterium]
MKEDLESRIEKLKQRRYRYQNSEGKWGYTDVFGKVVETAHLDSFPDNSYDIKGARELDTKPPLTYRELINQYTEYPLGNKKEIEDWFELTDCVERYFPNEESVSPEKVVSFDSKYDVVRIDYGKVDIVDSGFIGYGIKEKNNLIADCEFTNIYPFSEGLARVAKTDLFDRPYSPLFRNLEKQDIERNLDTNNKLIYDKILKENGELYWGFINEKGEKQIPLKYFNASDFHEELAAVNRSWDNEEWGYIDKQDNIVIPFKFDWAGDFQDGFARVLYAGLYYVIDKEGFCYESFDEIEMGQGSKFYL